MPTFGTPPADADEAFEALRGLAHAARPGDNPPEIYPAFGSLSRALHLWSRP